MTDLLFASLLDKWLTGAITEAETHAFFGMLERPGCQDQLLEQIGGDLAQQLYLQVEDHARRERIRDQVWLGIARLPDPVVVPFRRGFRRPRTWYAAAVILLLLGTAIVFFSRPHGGIARLTTPYIPNDLPPGGNIATLTLAGGQQILLDSAHTGRLASQGGTEIIKGSGGSLTYQPSVAPDASVPASKEQAPYNTLTTPRGGQYQLILPDGTKVWLNAASSITYPTAFTGKERKVTITGEAYFEVARNAAQPFHVEASDVDVAVLGTSFNINAYADEEGIRTTLLEGKVRVDSKNIGQPLEPGQQLQVLNDHVNLIPQADVAQATAWKNGLFSFTDADVPAVMRQLARWYNVEVRYEGAIPKRAFNGKIGKSLTLGQVLNVLTQTRIHYTIEKGNILTIRP